MDVASVLHPGQERALRRLQASIRYDCRHDLRTCKNSLTFKESLLADLELENAELSEVNEKLDKELKHMKRQESRRFASDEINDDCVDDGYGHWSNDEDDSTSSYSSSSSGNKTKLGACSECQAHSVEKGELFEQIEELHKQLEAIQKVNILLEEELNKKTLEVRVMIYRRDSQVRAVVTTRVSPLTIYPITGRCTRRGKNEFSPL